MIHPDFLSMLRCPENLSNLAEADAALIGRLNDAVAAGRLKNRAGLPVEKRLDSALVRADGEVAYPIIDEIPILLVDEGINLKEV
jgi:uncharacterized protein YbaR (Trm112 family)